MWKLWCCSPAVPSWYGSRRLLDLSTRSNAPEVIDEPDQLNQIEWAVTLRELRTVNRWLGGTNAILKELKPLIKRIAQNREGKRPIRVVDFGSGSGDIAVALAIWARESGHSLRILAVDVNPTVCTIARRRSQGFPEITVLQGDVRHPPIREAGCDLIMCSAFLHHFTSREISEIIPKLRKRIREGIVISDLHRHPFAYYAIWILCALFSRSAAVRNDGPLSVLKGFRRVEMLEILRQAGISGVKVRWRWAFRYVVFIPA